MGVLPSACAVHYGGADTGKAWLRRDAAEAERDRGPDGGQRAGVAAIPTDDGGGDVVEVRHPVELRTSTPGSSIGAGTGCREGSERIDRGEPAWMDCKASGD